MLVLGALLNEEDLSTGGDLDKQVEEYLVKPLPAHKILFRRPLEMIHQDVFRFMQRNLLCDHHYPLVSVVNMFGDAMSLACPGLLHSKAVCLFENDIQAAIGKLKLKQTQDPKNRASGLSGEQWCRVIETVSGLSHQTVENAQVHHEPHEPRLTQYGTHQKVAPFGEGFKEDVQDFLHTHFAELDPINEAVKYIMKNSLPNEPDKNIYWLCLLDLVTDPDCIYVAFRFLKYMPQPGHVDEIGVHRFSLSIEEGFQMRSSCFRDALTRIQIIGPGEGEQKGEALKKGAKQ